MRQVQGVQGSHKASTRDAFSEMVQETVEGTVWGKVIDRKVKKDIKILTILQVIHLCGNRFDFNLSYFCWLVRVSLFIELGGAGDLGKSKPKPWANLRLNFKPTSDKTSGQTSGKLVLTLCKNKWLRMIYEDELACVILTLLNIFLFCQF